MPPSLQPGCHSIPQLRNALKPHLSADFFKPSPWRTLCLLAAFLGLIGHGILTFKAFSGQVPWALWLVSLFVAANTSSFFFFFFHEVMHNAVVAPGIVQTLLGYLSGLPVLCSPRIWRKWHQTHHGRTGGPGDPDRARHAEFDDFDLFENKVHHLLKKFHMSDLVSYVVPFGTISGQHFFIFVERTFAEEQTAAQRLRAVLDYAGVIAVFLSPLLFLGGRLSFLGIYLPVALGQLVCNLYILSNHNAAYLTRANFPLLNSISVQLLPGCGVTHMDFGRHVEHHIFPEVTHRKLREVTRLLRQHHPDAFVEGSLLGVLRSVYTREMPFQEIV